MSWQPTPNENETLDDLPLKSWIGQAIGAASMCWEDVSKSGTFNSDRAAEIADALHDRIQYVIDQVIEGTTRAVQPGYELGDYKLVSWEIGEGEVLPDQVFPMIRCHMVKQEMSVMNRQRYTVGMILPADEAMGDLRSSITEYLDYQKRKPN